MRVFVGGATPDVNNVQACIGSLRAYGYEIIHDWTPITKKIGREGPGVKEEYEREKREIIAADAYVLVEHPECRTALVEVGFAMAHYKPVVSIFHPLFKRPIWYESGLVRRVSSYVAMRQALTDLRHLERSTS